MTLRLFGSVVVMLCASVVLAGCSGGDDGPALKASDNTFAGLDSAVVQEVLASAAAKERVAGDDAAATSARYQGMVRNFIVCRSALTAYQTWVTTGTAPKLATQPQPTYPAPTAADLDREIASFKSDLDSGDITLLRDALTNASGCGNWIPAKAGDQNGPTISDVVSGKA